MPTPDFSKIWASSSPLPSYTFSDEDYVTGWDFVGSAPPTKNEFDAWFRQTDQKLKWLFDQMQATASKLYPVGSVYISFNATDPSTLFGGTWTRLKDTFLLVNGDSYAPDTTGGSATKTISTNNLPKHTHTCSTVSNHTHERGSMNIVGSLSNPNSDNDLLTNAESVTGSGAFSVGALVEKTGKATSGTGREVGRNVFNFNAKNGWSGATSPNGSHTHTIGQTGSNLPINIMPPYTTVYAWRRTA